MKINFLNAKKKKEVEMLSANLRKLEELMKEASMYVNEIEKKNFQYESSDSLSRTDVGKSLLSMKANFQKIAIEEQNRDWLNTGLTSFADILRNKQQFNLMELCDTILTNLVKYVSANQGALFILETDDKGIQYLRMVACYAYNRKKHLSKRVELGEGLAGQCVLEKESIYLKEIPNNYVTITSGLGDAAPRSVFISPLTINDSIFGVLELASLSEFSVRHVDFITRLSESIASTIRNVKDSERTKLLLIASQQQAEELRAQEEEMRQTMEELTATREGVERLLEEKTFELKIREEVFGETMILSEADLFGNIIYTNSKLCEVSKYAREELIGKPHNLFRHPDMPKELFRIFWETLKRGKVFRGIIKNRAKDGTDYWVDGCFVPIKDPAGNIIKYVGARYHIEDSDIALMMYNKQAKRLGFPSL